MNITRRIKQILVVSAIFYGWHIPFDSTSAMAQADAATVQYVGPGSASAGGDVMKFPITTAITKATIGTDGINVEFTKKDGAGRWPDTKNFEPTGMGPLQYSIGLALNRNGAWYGSAPIEFWFNRPPSGTGQIQDQTVTCGRPFQGQVACNWFYDGRWAQLEGQQPAAGEQVGLFVVYGDARNNVYQVSDDSFKYERSNVVLFTLPNTGESKTFEFGGGGQAGESMGATLAKVRAKYPAMINGVQGAAILNEAAYLHRAEGWALLGKAGGNNCPQPTTGTRISCDYLIVNRGGTWFGQDVLVSAPGENEQSPANPVGDVNPQDNMTAAIADGSRTVVAPVAPGGGGPVDPPTDPTVSARLAALEAANATLQASVNNLTAQLNDAKGELAAQRDVLNNFLAQLGTQGAAIEELKALQGKPIPVSCRAKANLGGFSIPLSCTLGY